MNESAIEPTPEQIARLASSTEEGPIAMVNLLRFREEAGEPDSGMSGAEAYGLYSQGVAPLLEAVGAKVLSAVQCRQSVIGPPEAEWHMSIIVEYPSPGAFIEMVSDPGYREVAVHRTAALANSRLILSARLV